MSNFPKDISKQIINEFIGDIFEHIEIYRFKKICDEAINQILNEIVEVKQNGYTGEFETNVDDIYNVICSLKTIGKRNLEPLIPFDVRFNVDTGNHIRVIYILTVLALKMKLLLNKNEKIFFENDFLRVLNPS